MKRVAIFFVLLAVLVLATGCGGESIKIKGENEAWKVYTYPSDNMFGLEKIVLFENYAVAVFDVKKCDKGYVPLESFDVNEKYRVFVHMENLKQSKIEDVSLKKRNGKYLLTAASSYDEANKVDSSLPVHTSGLSFGYGSIWCYEDRTYLQYMNTDNSEITEFSYQEYYWDSGRWEEIVDRRYSEQPTMSE